MNNFTKLGRVAVVAAAGAILLSSCASNEGGSTDSSDGAANGESLSGDLNAAGASSTQAAQEAWIAAFQDANPDVTVNYDPSGSGAGREQFAAGGVAFAGSDAALKDEELEAGSPNCAADAHPIDIPVYVSPIAIVFNLEGIDSLNLDAATIAGIFKGDITQWNDPAIADQNPDVDLPDTAISPVHRSDDSGTTENFAEYLAANAPEVWTAEPDKVWPWDGGEGAQQTSGVVDAVTNNEGTIGYADASRAGDLGTVSVKVGENYVEYSAEAAAAVVDSSELLPDRPEGDLAYDIDRTTTADGVYPVVLVSYAVACSQYEDAEMGKLVQAYLTFITSEEGQSIAAENAGAAELSEDIRSKIETSLSTLSE